MCPVCLTTTAVVVAGTSGAGALGIAAIRFRWWQRVRARIDNTSTRRKS